MTAQRNAGIETSQELPVEKLYAEALGGFMHVHAELSKLPQDPTDKLQPANAMLRDIGVEINDDYSMFLMAAMGNIAMDMGLSALGLPVHGALETGLDAASGILMGRREEERKKTDKLTKKTSATSMFHRASRPKADKPLAARQAASTSILRRALLAQKIGKNNTVSKRRAALKAQMQIYMENLKELLVFKSYGVTHVRRVTVPNGDTGEIETYLTDVGHKPHLALTATGKSYKKEQPIDLSLYPARAAPGMGLAA